MIGMLFFFASCNTTKFVPEDKYLLNKARVKCVDDKTVDTGSLRNYLRQKQNTEVLGFWKLQLHVYNTAPSDTTTKAKQRLARNAHKMGEAPVIYDEEQTQISMQQLRQQMINMGYFNAKVDTVISRKTASFKDKRQKTKGRKVEVTYVVTAEEPYRIRNYVVGLPPDELYTVANSERCQIKPQQQFSTEALDEERERITTAMRNRGYYYFEKSMLEFTADSALGTHEVDVRIHLAEYVLHLDSATLSRTRTRYTVRNVDFVMDEPFLRKSALQRSCRIHAGEPYTQWRVERTYARMNSLAPVKYVDVAFTDLGDSLLDCTVTVSRGRLNSVAAEVEGTYSAGDWGLAVGLNYSNKNIFHGAEQLSIGGRASYEWRANGGRAIEAKAEAGLQFPSNVKLNLAYNYQQRYLFEVNAGYNGSENFAPGHRYGFFPAVSAGWVPTEEKWWNLDWMDHLKIRGSYGTVGNDALNAQRFFYMSTINKNAGGYTFSLDQGTYLGGVAEARMGSPLASWEVSHKTDAGLDIEMFERKLRVSGDYFYEHRTNILLERGSVPSTIGLAANQLALSNIGIMDNEGFDANLEFTNTTSSGLYYQFRANMTYAHNTVIEDDTAPALWSYQNTRGKSIKIPLGYVALGLFQSQEEIDNSPKQELGTYTVGDIKYKDVNKDGVVNAYDRVFIGYAREPEIMYGFGFTMAWKGFDLSMNFTGAAHSTILLDAAGMWPFQLDYPGYNVYREYYDHRYIPGGDNTNAIYPVVHNGTSTNNYQINTLYLHDASYLKLKTAELGYSFPRRINAAIGVDKLRIFLNGNNLLCFDGLNGIVDPESDHLGASTYPTQLAATIGVEVGF